MTLGRFARVLDIGRGQQRRPASAPDPTSAGRGRGRKRVPREKPPNAIGRGPLLASPPFGVAIVCIVKDEAPYLEEWLAYHVALGVDHVIVYDNGSTDGSAAILERYQNHGLVTRVDWPLAGGQLAAYNHALRFFGATSSWLAYFDVDEYLVPLLDDDIPSLLARVPDAAVVHVPRREFGFSGHRSTPAGLTIDAYTQVANVLALDPKLPPRVKSIVRPEAVNAIDVHLAFPADELAPGVPARIADDEVRGLVQLNHYYTRSFEEFEAKRVRGSATGRIARPAVSFDLPTLATDITARRFSARTSAALDRLRRLEPQPYGFGSQLRLEWFPRPNDLGRFAEFAIANLAAGLPEPARAPVRHLRDLQRGVGLVADLGDGDFRPTFGALSGSVHTEALVGHMRGRIEASLAAPGEDGRVSIVSGALTRPADVPGAPAELRLEAGAAEVALALTPGAMLRCWSVGFMLAAAAPVTLELAIEREDGVADDPVRLALPASSCLAGVVEVAPSPQQATQLRVRVAGELDHLLVHDLFAISCG